jgi:hypothetical protein
LVEQVLVESDEVDKIRHISTTLDRLISWLEHDILNKAGPPPNERGELYDFVVEEFIKLEKLEPHRIMLENKKDKVLNFTHVLAEKFKLISQQFELPIETVWDMCKLQRCTRDSDHYFYRSHPLQLALCDRFDELEEAVIKAMDSTERTSSMIENLNGRVRRYINNRQVIDQGYLDLLRFFLNHKPIVRSVRMERKGKTPAEILSGKPQPHWLELLGFERFKRAA